MPKTNLLLISSEILPAVFTGVIKAKELLASGEAKNTSQAVKMAGISRNAYYKYKDFVFKYNENTESTVTISALLADKSGVFSALTAVLYKYKCNILTLNQNMPVDGTAAVTLTLATDNMTLPPDKLLDRLRDVEGVLNIKIV